LVTDGSKHECKESGGMYLSKKMETWESGIFEYHDKMLKETMPKRIRVVPNAVARYGATFKRCIMMPSYVNIAYVDEGTMVDNTGRKLCSNW
jgi:tetrahydrodipicolinate N-succinyltransferase